MKKRLFNNILDLSNFGKSKTMLSNDSKISMDDIRRYSYPGNENNRNAVFIRREKTISASERYGDILRFMTAGLIMLTAIHFINIYQTGQVIKDTVVTKAFSGFENFVEGKKQINRAVFTKAHDAFDDAAENFKAAIGSIESLQTDHELFDSPRNAFSQIHDLLSAGYNMAAASALFTKGIESLTQWPSLFLSANNNLSELEGDNTVFKSSLTKKLRENLIFIQQTKDRIKDARDNLKNISFENIIYNKIYKLEEIRHAIQRLLEIFDNLENDIPVIFKLLGDRALHRYLVLLQNDAEARPTGGFIGSLMLVDVYNGKIIKSAFHDVYEFDGQLTENIEAPEDIAKISKNWRLRDSNYSPDFAISAEKAAWFLQKEKGPSVDTVIAVNQHILHDFLDLTGPVQLKELAAPLTKDNYLLVLSSIIESKFDGKNDPKKILRNFIPTFYKKLVETQKWNDIMKFFSSALLEKNILFYSRDEDIQNFFDKKGLSGKVYKTKQGDDYLQVVNTSIGGNKSDAFIQQEIDHTTFAGRDGGIVNEITLTKEHLWQEQKQLEVKKIFKEFNLTTPAETVQNIIGKGDNRSSVKIYVPSGSILMETDGIDKNNVFVREDKNLKKTYFLFEMTTPRGEKKTVRLKYTLPKKMELAAADDYRFFFQPQPAFNPSNLNKTILLDQGIKIHDQYTQNIEAGDKKNLTFSQKKAQKDIYIGILIGK